MINLLKTGGVSHLLRIYLYTNENIKEDRSMRKSTAISTVTMLTLLALATTANAKEDHEDRFKKHDTDGNGVVSYTEMTAQVQEKFNEHDQNHDGYIELSELPLIMPEPPHRRERKERQFSKMKEKMEEHGREIPAGFAGRMNHGGKPTRIKFIAKFDRDEDERVSFEEFSIKAIRHFKERDVNGDGGVTLQEAELSRTHGRGERQRKNKHHRD